MWHKDDYMSRHTDTTAGDADALRECFKIKPVTRFDDLCRALRCSPRTVFRVLKRVDYLTSFSHTGRYFTLGTVPRFDEHGLWFHDQVGFSQDGTLRSTLVRLIEQSPAGATHEELQTIVRLRVHDTLRLLVAARLVGRELLDAVFVYLHSDPQKARSQISRRHQLRAKHSAQPSLDPGQVIAVLLAVIRQPRATAGQLAASLALHGTSVTERQVEETFARYELGKKTAGSRSRRSKRRED